jgi:hypothetical protein
LLFWAQIGDGVAVWSPFTLWYSISFVAID